MNKKYVSYDKVRFLINKEKKGHNIMYFLMTHSLWYIIEK